MNRRMCHRSEWRRRKFFMTSNTRSRTLVKSEFEVLNSTFKDDPQLFLGVAEVNALFGRAFVNHDDADEIFSKLLKWDQEHFSLIMETLIECSQISSLLHDVTADLIITFVRKALTKPSLHSETFKLLINLFVFKQFTHRLWCLLPDLCLSIDWTEENLHDKALLLFNYSLAAFSDTAYLAQHGLFLCHCIIESTTVCTESDTMEILLTALNGILAGCWDCRSVMSQKTRKMEELETSRKWELGTKKKFRMLREILGDKTHLENITKLNFTFMGTKSRQVIRVPDTEIQYLKVNGDWTNNVCGIL